MGNCNRTPTTNERLGLLESDVMNHTTTLNNHQTNLDNQREEIALLRTMLQLQRQEIANSKVSTAALITSLQQSTDNLKNSMETSTANLQNFLEAQLAASRDSMKILQDFVMNNMNNQINIDKMKAELQKKKDELVTEIIENLSSVPRFSSSEHPTFPNTQISMEYNQWRDLA